MVPQSLKYLSGLSGNDEADPGVVGPEYWKGGYYGAPS